ncbi:MAG: hypothetical protein ACREEM_41680 [Blastocatellia bacterium]
MSQDQEPRWNPISRLPMIATAIDEMLGMAEEQYGNLQQARDRPHVLDDDTVGRVIKVFTEQSNDLWLYEEQLARWKKDELTATQRQEVERLDWQLTRLREAIASILSLAKEFKSGAIESVLAKSDIELALEVLSGKRKL